MSEHVLDEKAGLNDAMERSIMNSTLDNGETVSIVTLCLNIFKSVKRAATTTFTFLVELAEDVHELRAESERYSRTRW